MAPRAKLTARLTALDVDTDIRLNRSFGGAKNKVKLGRQAAMSAPV
jgi:hypothetical protein